MFVNLMQADEELNLAFGEPINTPLQKEEEITETTHTKIACLNAAKLLPVLQRFASDFRGIQQTIWLHFDEEGSIQGFSQKNGDISYFNSKEEQKMELVQVAATMNSNEKTADSAPFLVQTMQVKKIHDIVELTFKHINAQYSPSSIALPKSPVPVGDMKENFGDTVTKTPEASKISKIKKSRQQKLEDNRKLAADQQAQEKAKGFFLEMGRIPDSLRLLDQGDTAETPNIEQKGKVVQIEGNQISVDWGTVGTASCIGRRPQMEDEALIAQISTNSLYGLLLGVFDGHAGPKASAFVKKNCAAYLTNELLKYEKQGLTDETIAQSLKDCCRKLDADYLGYDGTTATLALIINGKLWVANVGDSRTIFIRNNGTTVQASEDAKPTMPRYWKKIIELGGYVQNDRVMGNLSLARAIGDHAVVGINGATCVVLPDPKITSYSTDDIQYVILACDGLYDVATTHEVGSSIKVLNQTEESVELMAKRFVWSALARGSSDNVTIMVFKMRTNSIASKSPASK